MHNSFFRFKQFIIHQDRCAMKVGTDGVLLGAWINLYDAKRILDVGSGTGLIALMLAQRSEAIITGIDIDEAAVLQARENSVNSPWPDKVDFIHSSFQEYVNQIIHNKVIEKFDCIVSNPPFHPEHIKPEHDKRRIARHSDELSASEIINLGVKILNPEGHISMIIPEKIFNETIREAKDARLNMVRQLAIRPTPAKKINRYLVEFSFVSHQHLTEEMIIEVNERHDYSPEYLELTKEYYLNF